MAVFFIPKKGVILWQKQKNYHLDHGESRYLTDLRMYEIKTANGVIDAGTTPDSARHNHDQDPEHGPGVK